MNDEMEEIVNEFITEAEESLDRIEPLFVELEQKGEDNDLINDIFRSMHTIKGAAGFLGYQSVVDVAHSSENIMKKLREGEFALSRELMDVILKSIDMLRILLDHIKEKDGIEEDVSPLVNELESVLSAAISGAGSAQSESLEQAEALTSAQISDAAAATQTKTESVQKEPEEIVNAQDVTQEISQVGNQPVTDERKTGTEAESMKTETTPAGKKEENKPAASPKDHGQKLKDKSAQNLRVDVERIDKVMDLAGEVVLVRNRLLNLSHYFDQKYNNDPQSESLTETVSFLDRVTSDMQLAVMRIRMQPIKKVLGKFPRFVRDMSATLNKDVELIITGEHTEVDKTVIEHIGDPLTHILRNSIDHGLESTEERVAQGKPAKGSVKINIYQKGNQVVIEVSDDGKGMDVEKLKQKAVDKGLITPDEAVKMTDEAATDLIFMAGFSTKEAATELSGRGVGMDVVNNNISMLNGYVEITTEKNTGSTFRICIPLTLAIIQALMVEVSGAKYAIPLSPIEETLKVSRDDIDNVSGQHVIVIRDRVCPLFELNDLLHTGGNGSNSDEHKYIIVISLGDKKYCIAVDRLLGQEEVVIKTLDGIDTSSSFVLGATITGDGKVVFILDVTGISRNLVEITKN
jgi:two-component system chemotaxis sensor kinase CheA